MGHGLTTTTRARSPTKVLQVVQEGSLHDLGLFKIFTVHEDDEIVWLPNPGENLGISGLGIRVHRPGNERGPPTSG